MDWTPWLAHFERNRTRPLPPVAERNDALPPEWVPVIAASLAKFQRGETGEGRIANEVRKLGWDAIDDTYVATLRAFVAEEGRHARILGIAVRALGGAPAPEAWSGKVFELGRRALDPRFELVALLGAEVAAIAAYQALAARLPDCGLRDAIHQIIADEHDHLRFHATLFAAAAPSGPRRAALVVALSSILAGASAVLLADHAALWRTLGVSPIRLAHDLRKVAHEALVATRTPQAPPDRAVMAA
ncbi:MAG: ferritin-like domain-containing protein [Myxococcota bacterium]